MKGSKDDGNHLVATVAYGSHICFGLGSFLLIEANKQGYIDTGYYMRTIKYSVSDRRFEVESGRECLEGIIGEQHAKGLTNGQDQERYRQVAH